MKQPRQLATVLAIVAMAIRALLPAGFMPALDATGSPTLVLCTSQGAQTRLVEALKKPAADQPHGQQCPFGFALTMAAALAIAPVAVMHGDAFAPEASPVRDAGRVDGAFYFARGPPSEVA